MFYTVVYEQVNDKYSAVFLDEEAQVVATFPISGAGQIGLTVFLHGCQNRTIDVRYENGESLLAPKY